MTTPGGLARPTQKEALVAELTDALRPALVAALRTLADELENPRQPVTVYPGPASYVGQDVNEEDALEWLNRLPVGAIVSDNEGDAWTKNDAALWSLERSTIRRLASSVVIYSPLRLTYLPEETQS